MNSKEAMIFLADDHYTVDDNGVKAICVIRTTASVAVKLIRDDYCIKPKNMRRLRAYLNCRAGIGGKVFSMCDHEVKEFHGKTNAELEKMFPDISMDEVPYPLTVGDLTWNEYLSQMYNRSLIESKNTTFEIKLYPSDILQGNISEIVRVSDICKYRNFILMLPPIAQKNCKYADAAKKLFSELEGHRYKGPFVTTICGTDNPKDIYHIITCARAYCANIQLVRQYSDLADEEVSYVTIDKDQLDVRGLIITMLASIYGTPGIDYPYTTQIDFTD